MQWEGARCCEVLWVNWMGQLVLPAKHRALCQRVGCDVLQNGDPTGAERDGVKKPCDWKRGGTSGARRSCDGQWGQDVQGTFWGGGTSHFFSQIKTVHTLLRSRGTVNSCFSVLRPKTRQSWVGYLRNRRGVESRMKSSKYHGVKMQES